MQCFVLEFLKLWRQIFRARVFNLYKGSVAIQKQIDTFGDMSKRRHTAAVTEGVSAGATAPERYVRAVKVAAIIQLTSAPIMPAMMIPAVILPRTKAPAVVVTNASKYL